MKTMLAMAAVTAAAFGINAGLWSGAAVFSAGKPGKQTLQDLEAAMHQEAFAHAKYLLFAEQARKNGREDLARLFEDVARTEHLEHFAQAARLAGLVGSDADNLRGAIQGESAEVDATYAEFERKAAAAGDKAAAARFQEMRRDGMKHREAFKAALDRLQTPSHAP